MHEVRTAPAISALARVLLSPAMTYQPGDHVFPLDLPRRFLCRVTQTESIALTAEPAQILKLTPLEGPWPSGTDLIRLDSAVVPARVRDLWMPSIASRARLGEVAA